MDDDERELLGELSGHALDALDESAALTTVEGELVGGSAVVWMDRSAMDGCDQAGAVDRRSPDSLLPEVGFGVALFENPLGTWVFPPLDVDVEEGQCGSAVRAVRRIELGAVLMCGRKK
ncbi:hypothetical protein [Gordonia sp. DT101]|uniref:hypothetical protein n=1 Tax=Gordonia sp. DT101 TaxID=3416545 RepID=UPI003CEE1D86